MNSILHAGSTQVRKFENLPGLTVAFLVGSILIASAHAAEEPGDFLQSMTLGAAEESALDLMIIAPVGDADSSPFPVLENPLGNLVEYELDPGVMTFAIEGPLSCFDLRADWQSSAVLLDVFDTNAVTIEGEVYGAIAQLGLGSDLHYLFDSSTLALDAENNTACFYDAGTGMALFGGNAQGGDLEVSIVPVQPVSWPYVSIDDLAEYQLIVTNNTGADIDRLAVQELFSRAGSSVNFPAGLLHDEYTCSTNPAGDCADASPEVVVINPDLGLEFEVPFIRGQALSLPVGASITFNVKREVKLSGGAVLQDAFGRSLPIHFMAVDLDNPGNHAATSVSLNIVGTGQVSAAADTATPTVSSIGSTSTVVTVQILDGDGQPLEEANIEIFAEVDPALADDIQFPAMLETDAQGLAHFPVQSERATSYEITFTAPALFEDGATIPASDVVVLDFQADTVTAFEFSTDFPDPSLSPSVLPDFLVYAVDQFGNLDTGYDGAVNINLITPPGFSIGLGGVLALGGVASFSGLELPSGESGEGYFIDAHRSNPTIEGVSNFFQVVTAPDGELAIDLDGAPAHGQSVDQASTQLLNIAASNVSVDPAFELAVVVNGRGPLDAADRPIDEFCAELFTDFSCAALLASLGLEAGFNNDSPLFEDNVTVRANAEPGTWELDFHLVMVTGPDEYLLVETFPVDLDVNAVTNAATGSLVAHRNGGTMDAGVTHTVREGELVDFGLSVINASVDDNRRLAVVFDGQGPGDTTNQPGMDICLALMEPASCQNLDSSIGFDNHFAGDIDLIEEMLVQILQEDALGDWLLNYYLVSFDPTENPPDASIEVVSVLSLNLEVIENTASAALKVITNGMQAGTQPLSLIQGQSFDLNIEIENVVLDSLDSIEGVAVFWTIDGPGFGEPLPGEETCPQLLQDSDCANLEAVVGLDKPYLDSINIFTQQVALQPDTATGTWNLEFWLVAVDNGSTILMEIHSQEIQVISDQIYGDDFLGELID